MSAMAAIPASMVMCYSDRRWRKSVSSEWQEDDPLSNTALLLSGPERERPSFPPRGSTDCHVLSRAELKSSILRENCRLID